MVEYNFEYVIYITNKQDSKYENLRCVNFTSILILTTFLKFTIKGNISTSIY